MNTVDFKGRVIEDGREAIFVNLNNGLLKASIIKITSMGISVYLGKGQEELLQSCDVSTECEKIPNGKKFYYDFE